MTLEKVLSSVGMTVFIKYYYYFRDKSREECIDAISEDYSDKSKRARTSHAKRIFREGKQREALEIILSSHRVDVATKQQAEKIIKAGI